MSDLVEKVARAIWKESAINIGGTRDLDAEWNEFRRCDKEPYLMNARAAIAIVLEEAAKVQESKAAKVYDHAKWPYLSCAEDIRSLIPEAGK